MKMHRENNGSSNNTIKQSLFKNENAKSGCPIGGDISKCMKFWSSNKLFTNNEYNSTEYETTPDDDELIQTLFETIYNETDEYKTIHVKTSNYVECFDIMIDYPNGHNYCFHICLQDEAKTYNGLPLPYKYLYSICRVE